MIGRSTETCRHDLGLAYSRKGKDKSNGTVMKSAFEPEFELAHKLIYQ